jgi:hypothetical protein
MIPKINRASTALCRIDCRSALVLIAAALLGLSLAFGMSVTIYHLNSPSSLRSDGFINLLPYMTSSILCSAAILMAAALLRKGGMGTAILMTIVIASCLGILVLVHLLAAAWLHRMWRPDLYGGILTLSLISLALLHMGNFINMPTRSTSLFVGKIFTCLGVCGAAIGISALFWVDLVSSSVLLFIWYVPFLVILGLFSLLASAVIIMFIRHTNRKWEAARETISERASLSLECPKCGAAQNLRTGIASCFSCGAAMVIELEESRCECGYLLYKLQGSTCPECGSDVSRLMDTTHAPARIMP